LRHQGNLTNAKTSERTRKHYEVFKDILFYKNGEEKFIDVPKKYRRGLIFEYHEGPLSNHVGREATLALLQPRFLLAPYMQKDLQDYIQNCTLCKLAKSYPPRRYGLLQQREREGDLHTLSIDLIGPLPGSYEFRYILVMIVPCGQLLRKPQ